VERIDTILCRLALGLPSGRSGPSAMVSLPNSIGLVETPVARNRPFDELVSAWWKVWPSWSSATALFDLDHRKGSFVLTYDRQVFYEKKEVIRNQSLDRRGKLDEFMKSLNQRISQLKSKGREAWNAVGGTVQVRYC